MSTFNSGNCRVPVSAGAREPVYDRLAFEQRDFHSTDLLHVPGTFATRHHSSASL